MVVFNYVIQHVARLTRILKQPFAHALLIGVGGTGRQSVTRLAGHIADTKIFSIMPSKSYGKEAWKDDMRVLLKQAGSQGWTTVFLFTDEHIKDEAFLEVFNEGSLRRRLAVCTPLFGRQSMPAGD